MRGLWGYGRRSPASHPDKPALEIQDLSFRYPSSSQPTLENIRLTVQRGEQVALVGPNGAGKSTLMKQILGIQPIQQGTIAVYGHEINLCRHWMAMVPQKSSIDWNFPITVRQVVATGRYVHRGWCKGLRARDWEAVDQALEAMEITHLASRQVGELSGGQQQRVMLARTLAHDAELLLLDEPLNHVDLATQELMFHTMEELCQKGRTVIVSTHDLGILTVHFSRALFLDRAIIADGPVKEVLTPQNIARAYGFEFHKEKELSPWLNG